MKMLKIIGALVVLLVMLGVLFAPDMTPELSEDDYQREDDYAGVLKLPLQYVEAKSGHKMAVRVAVPANEDGTAVEGKFPVLLVQSAYNLGLVYDNPGMEMLPGSVMLGVADPYFIKKGYIIVSVDSIGGGMSEGGWQMLGKEEQNGFGDMVDWIKTQEWYDGNLGVTGASYMAITGLFTAQQRPEDIKAVFAVIPLGDAMRGTVGVGGLFNALFIRTWAQLTHTTSIMNLFNVWMHPEHEETVERATQNHIDQIDKHHLPTLDKALRGDPEYAYDGDFWRTRSPIENIDKITAPTFIVGTVHDIFQRGAPNALQIT